MPTKPAAIHSIVSMKRSIDARFMSAPKRLAMICEETAAAEDSAAAVIDGVQDRYCASALYLVSEAFEARSSPRPDRRRFFLTPSAQVLTSGSAAFFHSAVCSGVSL